MSTRDIQGHVREGFSVTAGRDLEVGGSVEAAHLRAGRNIVVRGGVVGEHSTVDAGGHVTLRFLEAGTATADGDVLVASHLLHATVMSCGTVVVQGTPEDVAACEASHTGRYLARLLRR